MDNSELETRTPAALPQYHLLRQSLSNEIRGGAYAPGARFPTERELGDRFKVSRTTVVRALNDLVHEGLLTRHPGRGTFVADPVIRQDRTTQRSERLPIAFICQALHGLNTMQIIRGIGQACRERDYEFMLFESDFSAKVEAQDIERARNAGVAGIIVYPVHGSANAAQFQAIQRDGIPLVMVDRYYPTIASDAVLPDNIQLANDIVEALLRQGHRCIALLGSAEPMSTGQYERFSGFRMALHKNHIPFEPDLATLHPYIKLPDAERLAILSAWLSRPSPPTAILALNGEGLVCAADDLSRLGVEPGAVALACMDDLLSNSLLPQVSVIGHIPFEEMGRQATHRLLDQVEQGIRQPAQHVYLPCQIEEKTVLSRLSRTG